MPGSINSDIYLTTEIAVDQFCGSNFFERALNCDFDIFLVLATIAIVVVAVFMWRTRSRFIKMALLIDLLMALLPVFASYAERNFDVSIMYFFDSIDSIFLVGLIAALILSIWGTVSIWKEKESDFYQKVIGIISILVGPLLLLGLTMMP